MDGLISPILLYSGCVLGAIGVCLALPRRGLSPQVIGALLFALAFGVLMLALGLKAGRGGLPNFNFYLFSFIALGASLRVISHPRPVYAALYFILTILSSAGLYVLLSAEFMAFALVIVYAGAILITYLFVIMLATETPTADQVEALSEYDRYSREPLVATVVGFLLVAGVTSLMATGVRGIAAAPVASAAANISDMPVRVETALRSAGLIGENEHIANETQTQVPAINLAPEDGSPGYVIIAYGEGRTQRITTNDPRWPKDLQLSNIEGVGFSLLKDQPGSIELAGVVLLMAMLGAVVLAQKKVELDEQGKLAAQRRSLSAVLSADNSPLMGPETPGGPNVREAELKPRAGMGAPAALTPHGRAVNITSANGSNDAAYPITGQKKIGGHK
ncbi:MAG TPA: NADH-quinone oxidoreductase subunit J [Phycisphaerales bacterium]|nr:NADH-quinone oxidoreductase subunit J [Phycisphaerales bacterium]